MVAPSASPNTIAEMAYKSTTRVIAVFSNHLCGFRWRAEANSLDEGSQLTDGCAAASLFENGLQFALQRPVIPRGPLFQALGDRRGHILDR